MSLVHNHNTTQQHALIRDHVAMALQLARRMCQRLPLSVSREDIEGAALLGLTEAASRYDQARQEPFMAYATQRIRGAIRDYLRRIDHLPRRVRQHTRHVEQATQRLQRERGRTVTESEVAQELGISESDVRNSQLHKQSDHEVLLDDALQQSVGVETPAEYVERQQQRAALVKALDGMDKRELMILALYYQEGLTLREIGEVLTLTESRVCQLHKQILRDLRAKLS